MRQGPVDAAPQGVIEGYALSPAQRRWWTLQKAGLARPAQRVVAVSEPPDQQRLERALEELAARHEILRTRFRKTPGVPEPVQVVLDDGAYAVHDRGAVGSLDTALVAELEAVVEAAGETALRLALARVRDDGRCVLIVTLSGGCGDEEAVTELIGQLAELLGDAGSAGPDEEPLQYVDFAAWLEDLREEDEAATGRAFWRYEAAAAAPSPSPKLGRSGGGVRSERRFLPRGVRWRPAPERATAAVEHARNLDVSVRDLFTTLWLLLLHRLTGSERPTIGLGVAGREYDELEGALGPYSGLVPVGVAFDPSLPWDEAVRKVAETVELAREHQDLFDWQDVAGPLWPSGSGPADGAPPYFPVQLELRSPAPAVTLGDGVGATTRRVADLEPFDLKLVVELDEGSPRTFVCELRYEESLFTRDEAELLRDRFDTLLARAVDGGVTPCGRVGLLPGAELDRIRGHLWSDSAPSSSGARPMLGTRLEEAFLARAAEADTAPALAAGGENLTYGELEKRSRILAGALTARGVGPETVVGLHLERSVEVVVAVLAVLRSGGAFLVLPPTQPMARLELLVEDAGADLILTRSAVFGPPPTSAPALDLDDLPGAARADAEAVAPAFLEPRSLAYLVYTSGSTGRPKAVAATHEGIVRYLEYVVSTYELSPGDRVTQIAPLAFDAALREIFGALSSGASIELPRPGEELDAGRFTDHLVQGRVSRVLSMVPSHLRHLGAQVGERTQSSAVRTLLLSGEPLRGLDVAAARRLFGTGVEVVNQYGPTEATLTSSYHRIEGAVEPEASIPIGRPIFGVRFHLLDERLEPVPLGVEGGLHIAGPGVARGYHRRPGATAAAFLPDPYAAEPGERMVRTGDRARLTSEGTLELLGREDRQIKVRGNRVELGEIEAILASHRTVVEAAVVSREEDEGEPRLLAYAVSGEENAAPAALRAHLRERLPDYMVPDAVAVLPALPRTTTGKVDLAALPAVEGIESTVRADGRGPRTEVERLVADVWRQALRTEDIRATDHFFERGGHSLLATQVIAKLGSIFEIELPLTAAFDHPTLRGLATEIERRWRSRDGLAYPPPAPREPSVRVPASFAQRRLWFLARLEPHSATYNLFRALRLDGRLSLPALAAALHGMVRRHEALRTRFVELTGEPYQVVEPSAPLPLALVDLSGVPNDAAQEEADHLGRRVAWLPFALDALPLWRIVLLRFRPENHLALYGAHHVISDRWSMSIFVRELSLLYEACLDGAPIPLEPPQLQYPDFAVWQHSWLSSGVLEAQLDHWRDKLAGASPDIGLRDLRRVEPGARRRVVVRSVLEADLIERLESLARSEGVTLFMVLLAGLKLLLHRRSGREDFTVGTDIANRNHPGTDVLLGFFVNLLVLRTNLSGMPTFRDLLARVRETCLDAYVHQDLPYDRLVDELRPPSKTDFELFELLVVFQNIPREQLTLPDLEITGVPTEPGAPRFDLVVDFEIADGTVQAIWSFDAGRFEESGVRRMVEQTRTVLSQVAADPDRRLHDYELVRRAEGEERSMESAGRKSTRFSKFKKVKPRAIDVPQSDVVSFEAPDPEVGLPLIARPAVDDLDLAAWAAQHRATVEENLLRHGAVLFRGFDLSGAEDFRRVAEGICPDLFGDYGDLPREGVASNVYTSTPYPADKTILFHNESSHMHWWPRRQFFFCVRASRTGGETPIVDCRKLCDALPRDVFEEFRDKGIEYIRNFSESLDVSWRHFFGTDDKDEVDTFCREASFEAEWLPDDGLRIRQRGPAVVEHPQTGETSFFNQVQIFHPATLDPEVRVSLLKLFGEEGLPRNARFGDGSPISDEVMDEVGRAYRSTCVEAPWQEGDFLALDNMLVAHARKPFTGERKILVAMGSMFRRDELPAG